MVVTRLSSAGLIYKYYGKEVITKIAKDMFGRELDEKTLETMYQKIYKALIMEVDAIDNGVTQSEEMRYSISTSLSSRVGAYNSPWNAPADMGYS